MSKPQQKNHTISWSSHRYTCFSLDNRYSPYHRFLHIINLINKPLMLNYLHPCQYTSLKWDMNLLSEELLGTPQGNFIHLKTNSRVLEKSHVVNGILFRAQSCRWLHVGHTPVEFCWNEGESGCLKPLARWGPLTWSLKVPFPVQKFVAVKFHLLKDRDEL